MNWREEEGKQARRARLKDRCKAPDLSGLHIDLGLHQHGVFTVQGLSSEDDFTPRTGRIGSRGDASAKRYLSRVHAAVRKTTKSIGGRRKASGFSGTRIGRGAGVGHVSASNPFARQRGRRVIVKVHIARAKGRAGGAHVRYIQRDGVTREGEPGQLYDRASDEADGKAFVERAGGDRHQFRLIVSGEDAEELGDLKPFTRELMARAERDLGTKLDWVAADHFDTDNPHSHIVIRGAEKSGKDLVIAKDYLVHGFRRRASEIATEELGPRPDNEIALMRRSEVEKERFTSLDRELIEVAEDGSIELAQRRGAYSRFRRALLLGRLQKLEKLGLVQKETAARWRLSSQLEPTLRRLGTCGDIIRTMAKAVGQERGDLAIFDAGDPAKKSVIGRIVTSGGSDELRDGRYLIVDGTDGRTWHVDIGTREPGTLPREGAVVEISASRIKTRPADRMIAEIAAKNGGSYSDALHAEHDPTASAEYRLAHKRRLEALRRAGIVSRSSDGSWQVQSDFVDRAAKFEARRGQSVRMTLLSWLPLDQLIEREAATWLDTDSRDMAVGSHGFGKELADAQMRRQAFLRAQGLLSRDGKLDRAKADALRGSEVEGKGRRMERILGKPFAPMQAGERVEGRFTRAVDLAAGRYAVIERSKEFTLVPWREALERRRGQSVAGMMRGSGVSWQFGKKRGRSI